MGRSVFLLALLPLVAQAEFPADLLRKDWWNTASPRIADRQRDNATDHQEPSTLANCEVTVNAETLALLKQCAYLYLGQGDLLGARNIAATILPVANQVYGDESMEVLPYLTLYADTHAGVIISNGRSLSVPDRKRYYRRALLVVKKRFGQDSPEYAEYAMLVGASILKWHRSTAGLGRSEFAHDYFRERSSDFPVHYAAASIAYARVQGRRGRTSISIATLLDLLDEFADEGPSARTIRQEARRILVPLLLRNKEFDQATFLAVEFGREADPNADMIDNLLYSSRPRISSRESKKYLGAHVDLEFSLDEQGFVVGPTVITSSERERGINPGVDNSPLERAAVAALSRHRFAPRFEDGQPVASEIARIRIVYP